jgi:hypothetical protein
MNAPTFFVEGKKSNRDFWTIGERWRTHFIKALAFIGMTEKLNKIYFGNSTQFQLETERTPFELLNCLNERATERTHLKEEFYPLSNKLAYHFESQEFGKPANLTIKFTNEVSRTFVSTFDRVYPTFRSSLINENGITHLKGIVGFSTFSFLRSIYTELIALMFFIIFMIAPEFHEYRLFTIAGFIVLTLLTVLKHNRIKKRIQFMNEEITRILTEC